MIQEPTVKELLNHAENRYALVIAAARRARQIANGDEVLTDVDEESPVTLATNEISEGKVTICGYGEDSKEDLENEDEEVEEVIEAEEE